jgi:hypothetical protein
MINANYCNDYSDGSLIYHDLHLNQTFAIIVDRQHDDVQFEYVQYQLDGFQ